MKNLEIESETETLGDTPLNPPRRGQVDFIPSFIKTPLRRKLGILRATKREVWVLRSLYLRIFYNTMRVNLLIEQTPKPFTLTPQPTPDKGKAPDPFRWS